MRRNRRQASRGPSVELLESRSLMDVGGRTLLVGFEGPVLSRPAQLELKALRAEVVEYHSEGPSLVVLPEGAEPDQAIARLAATRGVRYAEKDGLVHLEATIPNDALFGSQWGLNSASNVDIDAPEGWDLTLGSAEVIVAVVDSGMDINHPDLSGRVWTNSREIPGNRRDDDRNGLVDDHTGWNFLSNNNQVRDDDGHGTHVAGTIAAVQGNAQGISGVAPGVRIMPLKFIGPTGDGAIQDAVTAIRYAVNQGARVINASWSGGEYSSALADAISFAASRNVVFVAAAGNESSNNDQLPSYPGSHRLPNVLSVAAIGPEGSLASFSNYGAGSVDIAAPGVSIRGTSPGGGYSTLSGTSMATPHVAGVAALLFSRYPTMSAADLVQRIRATAKQLPALSGRVISGGMVSARRALVDDRSGTVFQNAAGEPADLLLSYLLATDEYYRAKGGTPEGFLDGVYRDLLDRPTDPGGLSFWSGLLRSGVSRLQIVQWILESPETQRVRVARWFVNHLGRTTPVASLKSEPTIVDWGGKLARKEARQDDILGIILASDEYYLTHGNTPESFVSALYSDMLARPVDAGGLAFWSGLLRNGTSRIQVVRSILDATETKQARIAHWLVDYLDRPVPLLVAKFDPLVMAWSGVVTF